MCSVRAEHRSHLARPVDQALSWQVYDLFDDVMLLSEGQLAFSGPREAVVPFFLAMGFRCPLRKAVPDFLQEVTSRRDQQVLPGPALPVQRILLAVRLMRPSSRL